LALGTGLTLAQQIAAILDVLKAKGGSALTVSSITGGGNPPTVPGGSTGELIIAGSVGAGVPIPSSYSYVVNVDSSRATIGAANQSIISGTVGGTFYDSGNATVAAAGGNDQILLSGSGYFGAVDGGGNDTIFASGSGTISGGSGANILSAGSTSTSSNMIFSQGVGDFVAAQGGAVTVAASGTSTGVLGSGATSLTAFNTGAGTTISAGTANTTVVNSSSMVFVGGPAGSTIYGATGGTQTVFGGTGALTYFTGATQGTVVGGTVSPTLVGGAGGSVVYAGNSVGATFLAGSGNETIDASLSTQNDLLVGGTDPTGSNYMAAGSGNDTLFAGAGAGSLYGGAGSDIFAFFKATTTGQSNYIFNFTSSDSLFLVGYGAGEAATALVNGTSSTLTLNGGASTEPAFTIALPDNTKITFVGFTTLVTNNVEDFPYRPLLSHVFST
jgi:Ca2+-binding RTX toxin-like protein